MYYRFVSDGSTITDMNASGARPSATAVQPKTECCNASTFGITTATVRKLVDERIESYISSGRIMTPPASASTRKSTWHRTGPPTKTFNFEKLPSELRIKIWEELVVEPRIVEIWVSEYHFKGRHVWTLASTTPVPVCLHINRESRNLALQHYRLSFAINFDPKYNGEATIYFNFSRDIAYFKIEARSPDSSMELDIFEMMKIGFGNFCENLTSKNLKRIAIPWKAVESFGIVRNLCCLPKLSEVILVGNEISCEMLQDYNISDETLTAYRHDTQSYSAQLRVLDIESQTISAKAVEDLKRRFSEYRTKNSLVELPEPTITMKHLVRADKWK